MCSGYEADGQPVLGEAILVLVLGNQPLAGPVRSKTPPSRERRVLFILINETFLYVLPVHLSLPLLKNKPVLHLHVIQYRSHTTVISQNVRFRALCDFAASALCEMR